MYTLTSIVRRGTPLIAALAMVAASVLPATAVFADSLNPLTERSLLLSSSAPGFMDTDGSGNSNDSPNAIGENYAPAGSGPNGKKTGETFSFKVSSTANIKAFTLQYCTGAAGKCQAPGDNDGDARDGATTPRETNAQAHPQGQSDLDFVGAFTNPTNGAAAAGQFEVIVNGTPSYGWTYAATNEEDDDHTDALTGKNNYITLTNTAGVDAVDGQEVIIRFKPSESIFITNPGSGAFFVKINTYNSATTQINPLNDPTPEETSDQTVIDGGVTVANVMTDSIHITTKVLETMAFSVGTRNPDTVAQPHGSCDAIEVVNNNRLNLGDPNEEYSLKTTQAYDTHSYWRLSSNSSGGATVYYSGDTLRNTVGDYIDPIGAAAGNGNDGGKDYSHPGTEQFGLALVDPSTDPRPGTFPSNYVTPTVAPLNVEADYADGDVASISDTTTTNNAQFAFKMSSLTTPVVVAQDNDEVISCATSKVRYVGNIAADTPAGVYTTKINFLAAPQY